MSKKTNQNNINKTTEKSLCTSCGICKSVCPVDAVEMKYISGQYLPQIKEDKCINCELCLKICPGYQVDYTRLYSYKNEKYPENIFVGNHEKCYTAYTKDDMIRKKSTSGGLITEIIIQLLKNKKYKKAFVVRSDPAESGEARLEAVSTEKEVLESAKSKYIPVSVENVIEYIKNNPEDKIVVVGTSCHFHGIYKFLMEEKREDDNILFLGLFCDRTLNYNLINYFEDYHLATGDRLKSFDYRSKEDKGWPGNLKISSQSNKEKFIDRKIRIWLKPYFTLNRCHFCIDKLNQFADISFGDCYIKGEESYLG
ncbi:MAG: Coenzyme F420 hydrogenase/dehydrogenase, beta subunit C-terminal domain, partial [Halothermotrichaceae bacterium]